MTLAACGGANQTPKGPGGSAHDLPGMVVGAIREEAKGDPARAAELWLGALDAAVGAPDDSWQLATEQAALDALVARSVASLEDASEDTAIVYRTNDGSFAATPPRASIAGRLATAAGRASDPFSAGLIARALHELATRRRDPGEVEKWRAATGCADEATLIGPLGWTAVTGVQDDDPLAKGDAPIGAGYAAEEAFGRTAAPLAVRGRGCSIDPGLASVEKGIRDVVVDVAVTKGTIGVALRTHGAALLRAGGLVVLHRAYALGGDEVVRMARVEVPRAGTLRLVARVGMDDDGEPIEIDAFDASGKPLPMHAPRVGEAGSVSIASAHEVTWPEAKTDAERTTLAVAALAAGERPTAEDVSSTQASRSDAPPELLLAYARAVEGAGDLDAVHRSERARGAYERVLETWPEAWEAIAAHAVLAGVRRGQTEQRIWTLRDLEEHRAKVPAIAPGAASANAAVLDLFEASIAGHDRLFDRAKGALDRAGKVLPDGVPLTRDASRVVFARTGAERVAFECSDGVPGADRAARSADAPSGAGPGHDRLDCYDAIRATGDRARAAKELDGVRTLYAAPQAYLALTLRDAIADGDAAAATKAFDAMLPGERTLSAAYATRPGPAPRDGASAPGAMPSMLDTLAPLAPVARDAPSALPPLLRASGDDPTAPFAGVAEKVAAADRAAPILPSAATAVLAHVERYEVSPLGILHFVLFDVRRVSGTTDVEENAQADPPEITGRTTMRVLRRRMFKKDGRVVEPDRAPNASQAHADLSQLEQGDIVEAIYEGWTLPGAEGNVILDTPDLLPERTAVHEASIEVRLPAGLHASLWSHKTLGAPTETKDGATRVLRWNVKDAAERRMEEGTPKMDRSVGVSFSTATWSDSARALRETLAALDEHDPEVRAWALGAAKGKTKPREIVEAVVAATGASVKEGDASTLSDGEVGRPEGAQETTARTILANHEGSRTWLAVRALRELGIAADVVIAESEPFSADPAFPPHEGRFTHPLAVAHVGGGGAQSGAGSTTDAGDVWIDADVSGPPLPAGRISPELRGRAALHADGRVETLPSLDGNGNGAEAGAHEDEVDVRLALDANGDAKGQLTVLLRGRAAQELAEALFRIVGDERQRALRGVALAWVPFADVDDVVLSSTEESWQVALRATITVPGYAQAEGPAQGAKGASGTSAGRVWVLPGIDPIHAVYPRPVVATLGSTFASQGGRKDALAVSRAVQYHVHRRIELPAGATVARAPGGFEVKDSVLAAQRRIKVAPDAIEDDFTLSVTTGTVGADAYAGFSADAHAIDDGFLASTWVKPAP
ncbi:MAG: DUF3857 domain-containing protein [Polyangiaceae bacterium]